MEDNAPRHPCILCEKYEELGDDVYENARRYIQSMNPEDKVSSSEYENRLQACSLCGAHNQGLCWHCGCFVIVRAAKCIMHCPHPDERKW